MKNLKRGSICWLHFYNQAKIGHPHCGDYAYIKLYAPNHSKKIEDDEFYVKVAIKDIFYREINNSGYFVFSLEIVNKDDSCNYNITITDPKRLKEIEWKNPKNIKWQIIQNY